MKTEAIKAILSALQEYAGPLEEQEEEVLVALAELAALEKQVGWLRQALEFCSAHLTNDPLAAHERIRAVLFTAPSGKALKDIRITDGGKETTNVLVDIEKLREACTSLEMAPAGPNEIYRCLLCDHHSLRRDGIRHADNCWLGNILKTAREGGENV